MAIYELKRWLRLGVWPQCRPADSLGRAQHLNIYGLSRYRLACAPARGRNRPPSKWPNPTYDWLAKTL